MEAPIAKSRKGKRVYMILGVVASIVAGLWVGHHLWTRGKQSTDDAQIEADVVPIASHVSGNIASAHVHDNQMVKRGDVLFEINPAHLDIEVTRSEAELEAAREQLAVSAAQVEIVQSSSKGGLSSAQAALTGASASALGAADAIRA